MSVTLRGVFENRVLRKIFGPKKDEVTGECRRLCNEEVHDFRPRTVLFWLSSSTPNTRFRETCCRH